MNKLPTYLYRGDSDPNNVRKLKSTLRGGLLLTNLCNGGSGREIINNGLKDSIVKHVDTGWNKTHFLSFTEREENAFSYATSSSDYDEIYDFDEDWDFAIHQIDTSKFNNLKELGTGLYQATYTPMFKEFYPSFPIMIIDVVNHLRSIAVPGQTDLDGALANAEEDSEWLILPAFPFDRNELSSKMDMNCFEQPSRIFKNRF